MTIGHCIAYATGSFLFAGFLMTEINSLPSLYKHQIIGLTIGLMILSFYFIIAAIIPKLRNTKISLYLVAILLITGLFAFLFTLYNTLAILPDTWWTLVWRIYAIIIFIAILIHTFYTLCNTSAQPQNDIKRLNGMQTGTALSKRSYNQSCFQIKLNEVYGMEEHRIGEAWSRMCDRQLVLPKENLRHCRKHPPGIAKRHGRYAH